MSRVEKLMIAVLVLLILNFAATAGTLLQQDNRDDAIDSTAENAEDVADYVDDLRNPTPDARARNAAVTEAVRQVPAIKDILCDPAAFPEAAACQDDS